MLKVLSTPFPRLEHHAYLCGHFSAYPDPCADSVLTQGEQAGLFSVTESLHLRIDAVGEHKITINKRYG